MADVRPRRTEGVVGAEHVDPQRPFHHRGVTADERQLRGDTRIGHDHVQAAQRGDGGLDRLLDLLPVRDVAARPVRAPAAGRHVREQVLLEPDDRDARAALVQPFGQCGPDAARGAGDQHAAAGE
jgi:hypothetical protein